MGQLSDFRRKRYSNFYYEPCMHCVIHNELHVDHILLVRLVCDSHNSLRAEQFHKNYYESTTFMPRLGKLFIILNVVVCILCSNVTYADSNDIGEFVIILLWGIGDER